MDMSKKEKKKRKRKLHHNHTFLNSPSILVVPHQWCKLITIIDSLDKMGAEEFDVFRDL
jgi:hypothetical protein